MFYLDDLLEVLKEKRYISIQMAQVREKILIRIVNIT